MIHDCWRKSSCCIFLLNFSKHYLGGSFLDLLYKLTFPLANKFGGIISGVTTSKFFFFFSGGDVGRVPHLQDSLKTNRNFAAENLDGKGMMMHFLCLGILYPLFSGALTVSFREGKKGHHFKGGLPGWWNDHF